MGNFVVAFRDVSLMSKFSTLGIKRMLLYDYKRNAFIVIKNLRHKVDKEAYTQSIVFVTCLSSSCLVDCITTQRFWVGDKNSNKLLWIPWIHLFAKDGVIIHLHNIYGRLSIFSLTQFAINWTAVSLRPIIILFIFTFKTLG